MNDRKVIQISITEAEMDALADVNCWLSGFIAGEGTYAPGTLGELRTLLMSIKDGWRENETP